MSHIFISYSKTDITFARHLRGLLEDAGFTVWMDETKLVPSERWWSRIEDNIHSCAAFIVIMSPNSKVSDWVEREILVAEDKDNPKPIFPILLAGRGWTRLGNLQFEDMTGGEASALRPAFVNALQRYAPTFTEEAPPPPLPDEPITHEIKIGEGKPHPPALRIFSPITAIAVLVVLLVSVLIILSPLLNPSAPTLVPTTAAALLNTESPTLDIPALIAATDTAAYRQTLAAMPTPTLPPTDDVQATLIAARTATADAWTDTPTATPFPFGFSLDNTVSRNADWQPYIQPYERDFGDGIPMVLVPAGCFMMGSSDGASDEQPVHEVCFDVPFWIDKTEVTNKQYGSSGYFSGDDRPREVVTWTDAYDFCASRSGRLPTEAEWEYAARGPEGWEYPWGIDWNPANAVWNRSTSEGTAAVGSILAGASWVGALDMSGNVWEWVGSAYDSAYNGDELQVTARDDSRPHVLRGGSWGDALDDLRAANRSRIDPVFQNYGIGFRCLRSLN